MDTLSKNSVSGKRELTIELVRSLLSDLEKDSIAATIAVQRLKRIASLLDDSDLAMKTSFELSCYLFIGIDKEIAKDSLKKMLIEKNKIPPDISVDQASEFILKTCGKDMFPSYRRAPLKRFDPDGFDSDDYDFVQLTDSISTYEEMLNQIRINPQAPQVLQDDNGQFIVTATVLNKIVCCTKNWVYEKAVEIQEKLEFDEIPTSILENTINQVDSKLLRLLPDVSGKFTNCYKNLSDDNPESWANVADTCRRVIKDFADHLFPAQKEKIYDLDVTEDKYLNRIRAFIKKNVESRRKSDQINATLLLLGEMLARTDNRASRVVHSGELSKFEAERILIYTYLVIGDILALLDI